MWNYLEEVYKILKCVHALVSDETVAQAVAAFFEGLDSQDQARLLDAENAPQNVGRGKSTMELLWVFSFL